MCTKLEIIKVQDDAPIELEQLGSKKKFWFKHNNSLMLFKEGYPGCGEDWAEVIASSLCDQMNIPAAKYQLGIYKNTRGVVTENIVPSGGRLILGNELLNKFNGGKYDRELKFKNRKYTIRSVIALHKILQDVSNPAPYPGIPEEINNPLGIFISYIMLDALIGNQDRHHENWGYIAKNKSLYLAKTFDHASSLGHSESDNTRRRILTTNDTRGDLQQYAARATSAFYKSLDKNSRSKTLDAFIEFSNSDKKAKKFWLSKLNIITTEQLNVLSLKYLVSLFLM